MSKKKFTDGLDSLFGDAPTDIDQQGNFLLFPVDKEVENARKDLEKGSTKNFASDLDSFLKEAFEEAFEDATEQSSATKTPKKTKRSKKSLSGLDALIRSTIEPHDITFDKKNAKRITFLVDKDKLDKLKEIAKKEKAFLKDVISSIVEEYVANYQAQKK